MYKTKKKHFLAHEIYIVQENQRWIHITFIPNRIICKHARHKLKNCVQTRKSNAETFYSFEKKKEKLYNHDT